ncbi:MAG: UDP-N-acetylmuramoyl-L-alanyl-D-glutamate--2,6-diaminopimelate ligase [Verrucomicrobia bacterium]|nr:UDP-N-acetylmuramoyl-L-alanyl-D-glutamate--2,6-diaminopimelate ligase [Verrucomicrobiota bacterium]
MAPVRARQPGSRSLASPGRVPAVRRLGDVVPEEGILAARGVLNRSITGLATDPRRVRPGFVYFAEDGVGADGLRFVDEAVRRGAVAVVANRMPLLGPGGATLVQVPSVAVAVARAAQRFFGHPDRQLDVVAVRGAAGRTSVAHLLQKLLGGDGAVGLVGATHYHLGRRTVPCLSGTPGVIDLMGMLAQMRDAGCRQAVIEDEATATAGEGAGLRLAGVVVLGGESREVGDRAGAGDGPRDVWGYAQVGRRRVTFGGGSDAEVRAETISLRADGTRFRLVWPEGGLDVESQLIGSAHVRHVLAAVATAWALGRDPVRVVAALRSVGGVPGCLERLPQGQPFTVLVDRSGDPDGLRQALADLREVTTGRLLAVFGCAGNGDRTRRADVVRAVQAGADLAVATADNPRAEPLARIFADMRAGVTAPGRIVWIEDRRRAIACALELARPGDCVLLAGKGPDAVQELGDTVFPFDDRVVARELLAEGARTGERGGCRAAL